MIHLIRPFNKGGQGGRPLLRKRLAVALFFLISLGNWWYLYQSMVLLDPTSTTSSTTASSSSSIMDEPSTITSTLNNNNNNNNTASPSYYPLGGHSSETAHESSSSPLSRIKQGIITQQKKKTKKKKKKTRTLALLYPPGLIGGYRNQVMRLIGFLHYAKKQNVDQILLPTMMWSTTYAATKDRFASKTFFPVPMSILFDIDHWNSVVDLPRLVETMEEEHEDEDEEDGGDDKSGRGNCWNNNNTRMPTMMIDIPTPSFSNTTTFISPIVARELLLLPNGSSSSSSSTLFFFLTPLQNISYQILTRTGQWNNKNNNNNNNNPVVNFRKLDFYPLVEHCTHPMVYGGGLGAGRLWNDYVSIMPKPQLHPQQLQQQQPQIIPSTETMTNNGGTKNSTNEEALLQQLLVEEESSSSSSSSFTKLISSVSKALRPKKEWREVAHGCIREQQSRRQRRSGSGTSTSPSSSGMLPPPDSRNTTLSYIALHARVEVDMMAHKCSKNMEKNLSKIFDMVETFQQEQLQQQQQLQQERFQHEEKQEMKSQGIFVAVSREGMKQAAPTKLQKLREENWITLNARVNETSNFFECGEEMMRNWYASRHPSTSNNSNNNNNNNKNTEEEDYYGSLLPSILNFYIATQASAFIGVSKSSFSTDVWTTRYYQGKGQGNFEYTPDGILPISNGGLPPPHGNC